jgi:hypothetical protein
MTDPGQPGQHPAEQAPTSPSGATSADAPAQQAPTSASVQRMQKFTAANMVRSLLPLVLVCLAIVGIEAIRQNPADPVREVDTTSSERATAELARYPLLVPRGLPDGWRPTSVRTNAGAAKAGDPLTLQIGWYTPQEEYAAYVVSDDPATPALTDVLATATDAGTQDIAGETWQKHETQRGETALTRDDQGATMLVTGSADDDELTTLAASLVPYAP